MKARLAFAFLALLGVTVAACGGGITSGRVIAKQDTPGHYYTYMMPQYRQQCTMEVSGNTDEDICMQVIAYYLPIQEWQPEAWSLKLRNGSSTGWVDVTQAQYRRASVGQEWSKP